MNNEKLSIINKVYQQFISNIKQFIDQSNHPNVTFLLLESIHHTMSYQSRYKKTQPSNDFQHFPVSSYYMQQLNTSEIMQSIHNTEKLVQRTKLYVDSIPNKTSNYQGYASTSQSRFQQVKNGYYNQENQNEGNKLQQGFGFPENSRLPSIHNTFNKSPTPVDKLTDLQIDVDENQTPIIINSQQHEILQSKSFKLMPKSRYPPEALVIEQNQHQDSNNVDDFNLNTFRPIKKQKQTGHSVNTFQSKLETQHKKEQQKHRKQQKASTGIKSPLNKTFDIYTAYSSSKNPSTPSGQKQNLKEYDTQSPKVSTDQGVRYFKKKDKLTKNTTQFTTKEDKIRQRRNERGKIINQTLKIHNNEHLELEKIETTTNKYISSFEQSPKQRVTFKQVETNKIKRVQNKSPSPQKRINKMLFSNKPVNPFKSIQEQYYQKNISKSKSPTNEKKIKITTSPMNTRNLKKKSKSIPKQQSFQKREITQETYKTPTKTRKNSLKESNQIQINLIKKSFDYQPEQQKSQSKEKSAKKGKRHGITVLLSSPETMKITQIECQLPFQSSHQQFDESRKNSSSKKHYLQISIKNNRSRQKRQEDQIHQSIQKPIDYEKFYSKKEHQINKETQKPAIIKISDRIHQQLNRLQRLNRMGNEINLREKTISKQKQYQKEEFRLSKQIQKHYDQERQRQGQRQRIEQFEEKNKHARITNETKLNGNKKLRINQINSLTIFPSSLEKYKSSSNSQYVSHNASYTDILNNTISFTPQNKKSYDIDVPVNHIIRLQRSLQALDRSAASISKSRRRKIFDNNAVNGSKNDSFKRGLKNQQRIKDIYAREVENNNKSLETKLYNFLVEEDVENQRPSARKNKISPAKSRKSSQEWKQIFNTETKKTIHSPSKRNSPRISTTAAQFKYKPLDETQKTILYRSVESFDDTLRGESVGRSSVQSNSKNSVKANERAFGPKHKLKEQQIRNQIRKIKRYDFIDRYMTNYQLQRLMKNYMHQNIPPRKWSLLVIDQVYERIRAKKENEKGK